MPQAPPHPCTQPGCRSLVPQGAGARCAAHARPAFAGAVRLTDRTGGQRAATYGSNRWAVARRTHLEHQPICELCGGQATDVDHNPPHDGTPETFWDTSTWRSLCRTCHNRVSARWAQQQQQQHQQRGRTATAMGAAMSQSQQRFAVPVTLVAGPPGSGKTTWVAAHRTWGDLTVDVDALMQALSGLPPYEKPDALVPFALEARDAIMARLLRPSDVRHAWLIAGAAKAADRQRYAEAGAHVVVLAVSAEECLRRIEADPTRTAVIALWRPLVERWWQDYQRDGTEGARP